jgi:hypothetical protein
MKVTPSGYVLEFPDVLDELRATAARYKNPAHLAFVFTAVTAFEENGPDADPLLNGCARAAARLIFDEVAEAYITAEQATRIRAYNGTLACDFQLPYTSHRRDAARRAERERRLRNATTGLDRLRVLLTIPAN